MLEYIKNPYGRAYRDAYISRRSGLQPETRVYWLLNPTATPAQIAAIDANIKAIKHTTAGITLASLTAKFSLASPYFVTQTSQDLRWLAILQATTPIVLTWNDGTNTYAMTPGTAGTGETLDSEVLDAWANTGYDTFTVSGTDITQAAEVGENNVYCTDSIAAGTNKLFQFVLGTFTNTGGNAPAIVLGGTSSLTNDPATYDVRITPAVAGTTYFTNVKGAYFGFRNAVGVADWAASGMSLKQSTAPDTSGFTFTGGSGASFVPNTATFTLTAARP